MAGDGEGTGPAHPVTLVLGRLRAIEDAYVRCRPASTPAEAFRYAVVDTLAEDANIVLDFADGASDTAYGVSGSDFHHEVVQQLEAQIAARVDLELTTVRWSGLDVVALAAAVATDDALACEFCRGGARTGRIFVDAAVGAIIARVSRARTRIGRRWRVSRALSIVESLGHEAAQAGNSDPGARRQSLWCNAVVESLQARRR